MLVNPSTTEPTHTAEELLARLGEDLRSLRLAQDLGQAELATRAGVGRSALQNLEAGRANLETLVRVVRALGRTEWLAALHAVPTVNPLRMTSAHAPRQRASRGRRGNPSS